MMDDLRERIARAVATGLWDKSAADFYFDPRYEQMRDVRYYHALNAADAVLDIIRPLLKDGGAFEIMED